MLAIKVYSYLQTYKEQIKRESVLTATSILNNPIVKARYERYVKVRLHDSVSLTCSVQSSPKLYIFLLQRLASLYW